MKFYFQGKGFIYPKHKEAMESIGGEEVKTMGKADWIVVLTPNYLHYQHIIEALDRGKNVLCEKPLALSAEECQKIRRGNVFTVHQLRYHPILNKIPRQDYNEIEIFVEVYRDEQYFEGWKGDLEKSGGILYNLGIHYLDLVRYLFGEPKESGWIINGPRENTGWFKGENYSCKYTFSYKAAKGKERRVFRINGVEYDLREPKNLHKKVYQDLIAGKGVEPAEALKTIQLVDKLK